MNNTSTLQSIATEQPLSGVRQASFNGQFRQLWAEFTQRCFAQLHLSPVKFFQPRYKFGFRDQRYDLPDPCQIGQNNVDAEMALNRLRQQTLQH